MGNSILVDEDYECFPFKNIQLIDDKQTTLAISYQHGTTKGFNTLK